VVLLLLEGSEPQAVGGRQRDPRLFAFAQHEHVAYSGGEVLMVGISNVHDVEGARVLLDVGDDTNSADVVAADCVAGVSDLELGDVGDLVVNKVVLEGVTDVDIRVGEADCASVVRNDVRNLVRPQDLLGHLEQFKASLSLVELLEVESALVVVEDSEFLASLFEREHVHNAQREASVSAQLAVDLDGALLIVEDGLNLAVPKRILELLLERDGDWDTLAALVRALRRAYGE